jgi:hypothetical protein
VASPRKKVILSKKKTVEVSLLALVGCVLLLASVSVRYTIRSGANGDLLWHGQEAYLILEVGSLGYRSSYLRYFAEAITAFFNVPVPATNRTSQTIVFRFTPSGSEHFENESLLLGPEIAPLNDTIYADSDRGLVKWSGRHFEPTSTEEQQRFVTRSVSGPDFANFNGWSRRSFIFNKGVDARIFNAGGNVEFEIELAGKPAILAVTHGENGDYYSISWNRQGQESQEIWHLDLRPHSVSKPEYETAFGTL